MIYSKLSCSVVLVLFVFALNSPVLGKRATRDPLVISQDSSARSLAVDQIINQVTAGNMANADTPNYVPKDVHLKAKRGRGPGSSDLVSVQRIQRNPNKTIRIHDPSHPFADAEGMVTKPKVNPLVMMTDIQRTRIHSEQSMKVIQVASQMRHNLSKMMNY